ncbi:MAG TPA: hypothetical protein PLT69_01320, partial [Deltaproteobacteria bacterium]|nr:hypothetical protein [Deltaproteobacteria bacterium]
TLSRMPVHDRSRGWANTPLGHGREKGYPWVCNVLPTTTTFSDTPTPHNILIINDIEEQVLVNT